jgi:hypothetical protein
MTNRAHTLPCARATVQRSRAPVTCFKKQRSAAAPARASLVDLNARLPSVERCMSINADAQFQAPSHHSCHALLLSPGPVLLVVEKLTIP